MKQLAIIIITLLSAWLPAVAAGNVAAEAGEAYARQDYNRALKLYEQVANTDGVSSELYYNIANTYYRLKERSKAIIYYERALKLDPSNSQARADLEFVREKAQIDAETNPSVVGGLVSAVVERTSSNTWAVAGAVAFLLALLLAGAYVAAQSIPVRKVGFFGAAIMFVLAVFGVGCAIYMHNRSSSHDTAIVTVQQASLSKAPRQPKGASEVAFRLKEGSKVTLTDSVKVRNGLVTDKWYNVETADSRNAWINSKNLTII